MIKAEKDGRTGIFSDNDWKSGQPQRYGWREMGKELKTLPKEITDFIERRKAPEKQGPVKQEPIETTVLTAKEMDAETVIIPEKVKKPKTKKNDNPKQKGRTPGKHKPGTVAKA